jgi:hypothetical protein
MPVKYVDPKTGEFLPGALVNTGAPTAFGVKTPEQLVATSLSQGDEITSSVFMTPGRPKL